MAPPVIETDAVVVGAGPVGLFQVFQLGLQEITAHLVDVLPHAGGQCAELYADKPIYDIPGIAVCTGGELTERLLQQIAPFKPHFHLGHEIAALAKQADGRFLVESSLGLRLLTKTLFIAAGVGAFKPKSLQAPGIEKFLGTQLAYSTEDSVSLCTKHVVIVGGSELALNHALQLCALGADGNTDQTASLTLIHRRDVFQAAPSTVAQFHQAREEKHIEFIEGQITGFTEANGALTSVGVLRADSQTQSVPVDQLLVLLGLSPKLGPIAQWGLDMERRQLRVDTAQFSTSEPGIFAVGDINTYPGKKKLILCGFHEATLASYAAAALIFPDRRETVQYTTTSPRLHKLLGVTLSQAD